MSLVGSYIRGRAFFKNLVINYLLEFRNLKNTYTSLIIIDISYSYISLILS